MGTESDTAGSGRCFYYIIFLLSRSGRGTRTDAEFPGALRHPVRPGTCRCVASRRQGWALQVCPVAVISDRYRWFEYQMSRSCLLSICIYCTISENTREAALFSPEYRFCTTVGNSWKARSGGNHMSEHAFEKLQSTFTTCN
jgi:hypothetical protein